MSALTIKILAGVLGIALLLGGYEAWAYHERKLGAANIEASNMAELAKQNLKDAATNKKLAVELQAKLTKAQDAAARGNQAIDAAPVDPGSPADEAAAAAVNCMLDETLCAK